MAWTTPVLAITGQVLTSTFLNQFVVNNSNFLFRPPMCILGRSVAKSITTSSETIIDFDAEISDNYGMHTGADTKAYSLAGGVYCFVGYASFQNNVTNRRQVALYLSGVQVSTGSITSNDGGDGVGIPKVVHCDGFVPPSYAEIKVYQNSGSTLTVQPRLTVFWISG